MRTPANNGRRKKEKRIAGHFNTTESKTMSEFEFISNVLCVCVAKQANFRLIWVGQTTRKKNTERHPHRWRPWKWIQSCVCGWYEKIEWQTFMKQILSNQTMTLQFYVEIQMECNYISIWIAAMMSFNEYFVLFSLQNVSITRFVQQ